MNCVHRLALAIIVSFSPRAFAGEAAGVLKEPFKVLFEVVNKGKNGSFVMEVIPSWAPFAAGELVLLSHSNIMNRL